MKKIYNLYRKKNTGATIGIFDGVHIGHRKILKKLVRASSERNLKSIAITFDPHPRGVLDHDVKVPFLVSLKHRIRLIKELGVDECFVIKFTKAFSKKSAEDFIKFLLLRFNLKLLIVGNSFFFGAKQKGDFGVLKKLSLKYGFELYGVSPVKIKGRVISSTGIRRLIEKGDLKLASLMLKRPVTILGTVVKGRGIGRKIGFPTANINPHHESIPPQGVYAVNVKIDNTSHKGILNIGTRPTLSRDKEPTIELHIVNFKQDIYGKDIEIMFKRKIRNEKKFNSIEALKTQIKLDILKAKK